MSSSDEPKAYVLEIDDIIQDEDLTAPDKSPREEVENGQESIER